MSAIDQGCSHRSLKDYPSLCLQLPNTCCLDAQPYWNQCDFTSRQSLLLTQVHCLQEPALTPRLGPSQPSSVAPTPSPKVLAPGIRLDGHGKVPPRVPSSCRTIRRVLVESPESSTGWRTRPNSGMSGDARMQAPDAARAALRFGDQGTPFYACRQPSMQQSTSSG